MKDFAAKPKRSTKMQSEPPAVAGGSMSFGNQGVRPLPQAVLTFVDRYYPGDPKPKTKAGHCLIQLFNSVPARQGPEKCSRRWLITILVHGVIFAGIFLTSETAAAQKRDHLTDQETELVRFHQELDKRIEVFIRAIDRRFAIINGAKPPVAKKLMKDEPEWGDAPKGTRTELLNDIAGILDEAITNIDDVSQRDQKNPLISRSLRKLTSSANGYLTQLAALKAQARDPDEAAAIDRVADNANQIVEVGNKLPAPTPESDKKKKKP